MCFHTSQTKKVVKLENRFKVSLHDEDSRDAFDIPSYHLNGFSHPNMLFIPQEEPSVLTIGTWGIAPSNTKIEDLRDYYKKAVQFGGGLNAQSEKLFEHFIYKRSVSSKRCIIPVTGFYEPHDYKGKKYPYNIKRTDGEVFGLAGIYTSIDEYFTFTILTKKASPLFEDIHNLRKRQPVILSKENEENWLSDSLNDNDIKEIVNHKFDDSQLSTYTVSRDLFNARINTNISEIVNQVHYDELNTLF
ncbi:MAG: SOS response-associated peptidase [Winogradskyella sp.]